MNTRAKGSRLEAKSIAYLKQDGARYVFRGKGLRRTEGEDGTSQVDLIASYPLHWSKLVEVTVPANRARARKRLQGFKLDSGWWKELHIWKPGAKEPVVEVVE
jgi:hypothetical protein